MGPGEGGGGLRTALRVVDADGDAGDDPSLGLLFAGDLLPGWDDEWTLFERERLRQLRLHALESLSARLTSSGRHALALDAALTCVSIEPLRESAHRAVVAVHLAEHNAVEAVSQYGDLPAPGTGRAGAGAVGAVHGDAAAGGGRRVLTPGAPGVTTRPRARRRCSAAQLAVHWQKVSAGDWAAYAHDISRHTRP
ncbi:AfsR/SARP family transcriptional regulator [Streptomyces sp. NPDC001272]